MGKSEITCDCEVIHDDVVAEVKNQFPADETLFDIADFFKIFGDTTRVKILYALDKHDLCVCDISTLLNMTISAVSHQLKVLRENNLVKTRREGKVVFYSLADDHVKEIIECGMEHVLEIKNEE
ncbi:MAG: metalloregulator ArsR/SmtB family transcription factor [Treponema sp.]|nr:metalloregulator ArsR/SmtB family transcription factor [Treponema sp.]